MAYDGTAWDETTPTDATLANEIDDIARDIKIGVRSRLAIEHIFPSSQSATSSAGGHITVSLQGQTGAPSLPVVNGTTQDGVVWAGTDGSLNFVNATTSVQLVTASAERSPATALTISGQSTGSLLTYIGTTGWGNIAIATSGAVLVSTGTGGEPIWQSITTAIPNPLPAAWGVFGASGTANLLANYGVSSVARTGAGEYSIVWTTAYTSTNYSLVGNGVNNGTGGGLIFNIRQLRTTGASIQITDVNGGAVDAVKVTFMAMSE